MMCSVFRNCLTASSQIINIRELSSKIQHSNGLLDCFFEASSDRHDFAHGLHLGPNLVADSSEFPKVPAGNLDDYIVERRFEACRSDPCHPVGELGQSVAD